MEIETDAFFGQLTFDPLYIVPFNSAQGFDLEVTDGAMRSKKGKQGVKRRANWSLLGQNCAEPWQNWYILYIYSFTYPKRYSKLNFLKGWLAIAKLKPLSLFISLF